MKPAAFDYHVPSTIDEAVAILAEHGSDARVLAGGQSLVRLMNTRELTPGVVIDINRIPGQDTIALEDGTIRLGALVRQRASETSPIVREHAPVFSEAGAEVAHVSVRQRGTVVGSIAFADPCGELPTALLALDGRVVARSSRGERVIEAADLLVGAYTTSVADDELLVEARVPALSAPRTGTAFVEVTRRHGDIPMCSVASIVVLDEEGSIAAARISVGAVADRPTRATSAEQSLVGRTPTDDVLRDASQLVADSLEARPTVHGSAAYRRHLSAVVTQRSLARAVGRATEGNTDA